MTRGQKLPYHDRVEAQRDTEIVVIAGHPKDAWSVVKSYVSKAALLLLVEENGPPDPDTLVLPRASEALVIDQVPLDTEYRVDFSARCARFGCKRVRWVSPDGSLMRIGPAA